jgi:hypothetical protein
MLLHSCRCCYLPAAEALDHLSTRWRAVWVQPGLSREVSTAVDEDWEDAPDAPLAALRLATAKLSVSDAAEGASPDGKKRCVLHSLSARLLHCPAPQACSGLLQGAQLHSLLPAEPHRMLNHVSVASEVTA